MAVKSCQVSSHLPPPPKEQKPLRLEPPHLVVAFCLVHSFTACREMGGGGGIGGVTEGAVLTVEGSEELEGRFARLPIPSI